LGSGSLLNYPIVANINESLGWSIPNNGLMTNPVGAFIVIGIIIWVQRYFNGYVEDH
jgi:Na+-transporting NADH:ubiquinone oxidoreductase subunit D